MLMYVYMFIYVYYYIHTCIYTCTCAPIDIKISIVYLVSTYMNAYIF